MLPEELEDGVEDGIEDTPMDDVLVESDFDSSLDDTSVTISLHETGEEGSGYHTRNDPLAPKQRQVVTERRGIIAVQCKSSDIVHGSLGGNEGGPGTLLIYDLYLDSTKRSRRIISASLEFEFASIARGVPAPQVHAISPRGGYALLPTTQDESIVSGTEANADFAQFGANFGGKFKWEKTVTRTTNDNARVTGSTSSNYCGKEIGARWTIQENPSIQSGTPSFFRCAILLKRELYGGEFMCRVKIKVEADWKTRIGKLFGSTPADDPILFDAELPPTNKLQKYDVWNLSSVNLDEIWDIRFDRPIKDAGMA